jgi:hypothetical protein
MYLSAARALSALVSDRFNISLKRRIKSRSRDFTQSIEISNSHSGPCGEIRVEAVGPAVACSRIMRITRVGVLRGSTMQEVS